jgi:hypothetical protein
VGCPLVDAFGRGAFELPGGGLCRPLTGPPLVGPRGRNRPVISFSKAVIIELSPPIELLPVPPCALGLVLSLAAALVPTPVPWLTPAPSPLPVSFPFPCPSVGDFIISEIEWFQMLGNLEAQNLCQLPRLCSPSCGIKYDSSRGQGHYTSIQYAASCGCYLPIVEGSIRLPCQTW